MQINLFVDIYVQITYHINSLAGNVISETPINRCTQRLHSLKIKNAPISSL